MIRTGAASLYFPLKKKLVICETHYKERMVWKNEGTLGTDVKPGMRVRVVLKKDQRSGILTEGIVRDLLTRSASHPHGIKVRLGDGQVGRVKMVAE